MTDKKEFYQLLSYTDDVDLNQKLEEWENFYNFNRPHGSFKGKTPYEILKSKTKIIIFKVYEVMKYDNVNFPSSIAQSFAICMDR